MNRPTIYLFYLLLTLACIGCRSTLVPQKGLFHSHKSAMKPLDFKYLTLSGGICYQDGASNITVHTKIKIQKDSIIWFSLSVLGFEVAQGIITQAGITAMNRLNRAYYVYDYPTLFQKLHFKLNYAAIQALLLGDPLLAAGKRKKIQKTPTQWIVKQKTGDLAIENLINRNFMKLEKITIQEPYAQHSFIFTYKNFKKLRKNVFAHYRDIKFVFCMAETVLNGTVTIKNLKANLSEKPLQFPFAMPKKYAQ